MSAIIQETGGPLKEGRAVDGKLKSRLEWPNLCSRLDKYAVMGAMLEGVYIAKQNVLSVFVA